MCCRSDVTPTKPSDLPTLNEWLIHLKRDVWHGIAPTLRFSINILKGNIPVFAPNCSIRCLRFSTPLQPVVYSKATKGLQDPLQGLILLLPLTDHQRAPERGALFRFDSFTAPPAFFLDNYFTISVNYLGDFCVSRCWARLSDQLSRVDASPNYLLTHIALRCMLMTFCLYWLNETSLWKGPRYAALSFLTCFLK